MAKETNANIGFEIGKYIDEAMEAIEKENTTLKGVLPKNYGTPDLDKTVLGDVVDLFGRTYEYCIAEFAAKEGKDGGGFYTPSSIVKLLL